MTPLKGHCHKDIPVSVDQHIIGCSIENEVPENEDRSPKTQLENEDPTRNMFSSRVFGLRSSFSGSSFSILPMID